MLKVQRFVFIVSVTNKSKPFTLWIICRTINEGALQIVNVMQSTYTLGFTDKA